MNTMRTLRSPRSGLAGIPAGRGLSAGLRFFAELFARLHEARSLVDEKHAVKVVDYVVESPCQKARAFDPDGLSVPIQRGCHRAVVALHVRAHAGHAHATLPVPHDAVSLFEDRMDHVDLPVTLVD